MIKKRRNKDFLILLFHTFHRSARRMSRDQDISIQGKRQRKGFKNYRRWKVADLEHKLILIFFFPKWVFTTWKERVVFYQRCFNIGLDASTTCSSIIILRTYSPLMIFFVQYQSDDFKSDECQQKRREQTYCFFFSQVRSKPVSRVECGGELWR